MNQSIIKSEEKTLDEIAKAQENIINTCNKTLEILNKKLDENKNKISINQLVSIIKSLTYSMNFMQSVKLTLTNSILEMKETKIFDDELPSPQKIEREIKISTSNPEESLKKLQEAMLKINEKWHKK